MKVTATDNGKSNTTDHDLLIELRISLLDIKQTLQNMSNQYSMRLNEHEIRVRKLEDLALTLNPGETFKELHNNTEWINGFKSRLSVYIAIGTIGITILSSILIASVNKWIVNLGM